MAQIVEELKDEKEKLLEQLREISALKVKESEDCYAEKKDRIRELEEKLATASQNITDCEQSIQHYQLQLAKAEYELETTVARLTHLEKQASTLLYLFLLELSGAVQPIIIKYIAILQGTVKPKQNGFPYFKHTIWFFCYAQNTTNAMDSIEVENLREECEAAQKKAEDNLQRYFRSQIA